MSKKYIVLSILALSAVMSALLLLFRFALPQAEQSARNAITETTSTEPAPALSKTYKNEEYRFSLETPENFETRIIPSDDSGATTIVLQGANSNGIQIRISKYDDSTKVVTANDVRANIPDMKVSDDQVVDIGNDYKGIAFLSDNEAFGGASREVWFVFKGNLYQISTYARLDPLLKAMFSTWKFF